MLRVIIDGVVHETNHEVRVQHVMADAEFHLSAYKGLLVVEAQASVSIHPHAANAFGVKIDSD